MAELRRDPSTQELLERLIRQGRELALLQKEVAQMRDDIELLNSCTLDVLRVRTNERADVTQRLSLLEDRIFPDMGPILQRMEEIVGKFSGWQLHNPLDRRNGDSQDC